MVRTGLASCQTCSRNSQIRQIRRRDVDGAWVRGGNQCPIRIRGGEVRSRRQSMGHGSRRMGGARGGALSYDAQGHGALGRMASSDGMPRIRGHRNGARTRLAPHEELHTRIRSGGVHVGRGVGIFRGRMVLYEGVPYLEASLLSKTLGPCRRQLMAGK